jgi:hypothetical protein
MLLEVVVGMTILTIAATSWIAVLRQTMHGVRELRGREQQVLAASAELGRITLWPRVQLDARVGSSRLAAFTITVGQPAPSLYAVALRDTTIGAVVLSTSIYAPEGNDAER